MRHNLGYLIATQTVTTTGRPVYTEQLRLDCGGDEHTDATRAGNLVESSGLDSVDSCANTTLARSLTHLA